MDKKFTEEELKQILEQHELWLKSNRKQGERANLEGANLDRINLKGANLKKANSMPAYNIFNARINNSKRFEALALELSGEKVEESFNYEGAYASAIDGIDSKSMYAFICFS